MSRVSDLMFIVTSVRNAPSRLATKPIFYLLMAFGRYATRNPKGQSGFYKHLVATRPSIELFNCFWQDLLWVPVGDSQPCGYGLSDTFWLPAEHRLW